LRLIVANRMPPHFGTATAESEEALATAAANGLSDIHRMVAGLCEDAETAHVGVNAFAERTRARFPHVSVASASELAVDIHDMASITDLAQQLAASAAQQ
jgi:hypothetical protein